MSEEVPTDVKVEEQVVNAEPKEESEAAEEEEVDYEA